MTRELRFRLCDQLLRQQLPNGGWSFASRTQAVLEPTCLALLALRSEGGTTVRRGLAFLVREQHSDGSWPAFQSDDPVGCWVTSLAVIALRAIHGPASPVEKGVRWLLSSCGREAHWLWRWKFRTTDTRVRFDPGKYGWPWIAGAASWVIPTSFALVALEQNTAGKAGVAAARIERGTRMLLDRACLGGGWNAGNGVVFGVPLAPHLDATAIALLALRLFDQSQTVLEGLHWLRVTASGCHAVFSLAWATLALDAFDAPHAASCRSRLVQLLLDSSHTLDPATLAVAALALEGLAGADVFGAPYAH